MPSDWLQLSVVAVGLGAAVARRTVEWAADAALGLAGALARVADGTAFAFAAACVDRLAWGLADAEAAGRPVVLPDLITLDAAESTPAWVALVRGTARSAERPAACG
jgi:hypothetical protein